MTKPPRKRAPYQVVRNLRTLRRRLEMGEGEFSARSPEETERIVKNTELWRHTWVLPVIDDLIAWANGEKDAKEL